MAKQTPGRTEVRSAIINLVINELKSALVVIVHVIALFSRPRSLFPLTNTHSCQSTLIPPKLCQQSIHSWRPPSFRHHMLSSPATAWCIQVTVEQNLWRWPMIESAKGRTSSQRGQCGSRRTLTLAFMMTPRRWLPECNKDPVIGQYTCVTAAVPCGRQVCPGPVDRLPAQRRFSVKSFTLGLDTEGRP